MSMKNLIYLFIAASMMLVTACSDDDEYVFSELPSERIEAFRRSARQLCEERPTGGNLFIIPKRVCMVVLLLCFDLVRRTGWR